MRTAIPEFPGMKNHVREWKHYCSLAVRSSLFRPRPLRFLSSFIAARYCSLPVLTFVEKGSMGISSDCQNFSASPIIPGMGKAKDFTFCTHIQKTVKTFRKSDCGRSRGIPQIFTASVYRAHCAVIFAIAQLSCYYYYFFLPSVVKIPRVKNKVKNSVWS